MIVVKLKGGLGNQLFQYCSGYALGEKYRQGVVYDISSFQHGSAHPGITKQKYQLNNILNTNIIITDSKKHPLTAQLLDKNYINKLFRILKICNFRIGNWNYILQNRSKDKVDIPDSFDNIVLDGYWQNLSWFEKYKDHISNQIQFKNIGNGAQKLVEKEITLNSVAIHVRRTDLLSDNANIQNGDYYKKSLDYILNKTPNPYFFVFSDDIGWCKDNLFKEYNHLSNKIIYSDNRTAEEDLFCMMNCKHNIIAHSTFSWWAAWLNRNNNQIVISPKFGERKDIIPKNWIVF